MYFWDKKEDLYFGSVSVMNNFSTVASIFQPFANLSMVSSKLPSLYILVQYSTQLDLLVLFHSRLTEKYLWILSLKITTKQWLELIRIHLPEIYKNHTSQYIPGISRLLLSFVPVGPILVILRCSCVKHVH